MIQREFEGIEAVQQSNTHGRITVAGVRVDDLTLGEATEMALREGQDTCWVVTPNAVMLDACRRDASLCALLNRADLSVADGVGVLWAARRQGTPLRERVAGIDFGERVLSRAAEEGMRVFLLGGNVGVAERAAEQLCARYPGLCVCGCCDGYFDCEGEEDRRVTAHIRDLRPDLLFVCMGFPRQERWIEAHLHLFPSLRLAVGLGGSLDVWAGAVRRAPRFIACVGLEWAWRMAQEPKRLRHLPAILHCVFARRGRTPGEK